MATLLFFSFEKRFILITYIEKIQKIQNRNYFMKIGFKHIAQFCVLLSLIAFFFLPGDKISISADKTPSQSIVRLKSALLLQVNYASLIGDSGLTDFKNSLTNSKLETTPTIKDNMGYSEIATVKTKKVPLTGNLEQMKYFYEALKTSKTKTLRIAHIGDSAIFGDVISEYLRLNFQEKFGGNGQGFISMINNNDAYARRITKNTYSNDWQVYSILKRYPGKLPLGLNGSVFIPTNESWAKFETKRDFNAYKYFKTARLFYSNGKNNSLAKYSFNNGTPQSLKLKEGENVNIGEMSYPSGATSLKLNFNVCESSYFYGISLENGVGLYLDNFPFVGNSGISLREMPMNVLKDFNELQNYKLIIIQFGANVLSPEHNDYTWYATQMEKVINYFKQAFPNASIIIVGMSDKIEKKNFSLLTDPKVFSLIQAQKSLAKKTNVAFWNYFEAMGGANSMIEWVNANPPLANKDYLHLTNKGGKKIADLLTEAIMNEYYK